MKNKLKLVLHIFLLTLLPFVNVFAQKMQSDNGDGIYTNTASQWVGTWSTAPQLVEPGNNPPSPGLSNNTLRQIVHVSIGGDSLRMRFSNEFSTSPVKLNSVHIAVSTGGGKIDTTTEKTVYFNGMPDATMAPGTAINSDPFQFALQPLSDVAITIYFGSTSPTVTGHPGSRTTSYILTGNEVSKAEFSGAVQTDHWYVINTLDVLAPDSAYAVAILGNSITDGRGSSTNKQNRWPDELARRLQGNPDTRQVAVLNEGIGGNCVLRACLGPSAISRFERDVLNQNGVKWVIILEGINDVGNGGTGVGNNLINAYKQMINSAHAKGSVVYGATLLPMKGSSYYSTTHETERRTVNEWIRNSGFFDGVIDLDKALRNPNDTLSLLPAYDTGDHLHPNEAGHHAMAEAVDLTLFSGELDTDVNERSENQPSTFSLSQNYPNPFNPVTTIKYSIPRYSFVSLKVFDVLSNKVANLVEGLKQAGNYVVSFNGSGLSSGVYFYRLQSGSFVETKKLVLLR
jgi:lysophospholipase L1-like esterase